MLFKADYSRERIRLNDGLDVPACINRSELVVHAGEHITGAHGGQPA